MPASQLGSEAVGFADGNLGHTYTYPLGAPSVGDLDVFGVSSATVVTTPSGFSVATSAVGGQGAYLFYRKAVGGEASTTSIVTAGDFNTSVEWSRWSGVNAFDVAANTQVDGSGGTTTPSVSTGTLAETNELVVFLAALHSATPTAFTYSSGYATLGPTPVTQNTSGGGPATAAMSFRTDAGTAAETPSISWTTNVDDRYALVAAFTTIAPTNVAPDSVDVAVSLGSPTLTDGSLAVAPGSIDVTTTLGAPTLSDGSMAVAPGSVDVTVSLGAPTLADGSMAVAPGSVDVTTTLGAPTLADGSMAIAPDGIDVAVTLGAPDLNLATATISPDPVNATVTLGAPTLVQGSADTLLLPEAQLLLDCLCAALALQTNPPLICAFRAGDQTIQDLGPLFDECCDGQAYVRITGFSPTGLQADPFPATMDSAAVPGCGVPSWSLHLEMGVFRCMKTERLTSADWLAITSQQMLDAKSMRIALCCWLAEHDPQTVQVGDWSPHGPEGGCIGGTMPVSVEVINCGECD